MSFVKQLAGETAIYGLSNILSRILHFVLLTPYLTRVFADTAEYGVFSDLYAYAAFLIILFTYRLETGFFRFGTKNRQDEETLFTTSCASHLVSTALLVTIIFAFRQPLANVLEYESQPQYVVYFAFIIGLDAVVAIPFARLRLQNKAFVFAFIKLCHTLLNLCLVFFFLEGCPKLIELGFDWWKTLYSYEDRLDLIFIANLIASSAVLVYFLPLVWRTSFIFSWPLLKKLFAYSLPLLLVGLAGVFNQSSAVPLIKYLMNGTSEENLALGGIYGAAAKLAILMNLFTVAFNYAAEPFFFKQADQADARSTYAEIAQAFALVASGGFLFINLFLDVFQYLIGPEYRSGLYIVPILLLAYWFLGMYYNVSVWYKVTDRTKVGALIALMGSIITFVVAFLFLNSFGIVVMAIATLTCYVTMVVAGYLTGQYFYPINYPLAKIFGYLFLGVGLSFLGIKLNQADLPIVLLIALKVVLLFVFVAGAFYVDRSSLRGWLGIKSKT